MAIEFVKSNPGDTWRMKITAGTRAQDRSVAVGEIVELPVAEAVMLLASHKAVRYTEPPAVQVPEVETAPVATVAAAEVKQPKPKAAKAARS